MSKRTALLAGGIALGSLLVPALAHADVRIDERSTVLDATVNRWTFIKGDRRSVVSRAEPTGALYNAGARFGAYVEIARPDKELIWELDPQERSYKEVTEAQFKRLLQKGIQAPRVANEQPLRSLYQSETTAIEVVPTGNTKKIAGFQAEQVLARVVVGAQNLISGNKFRFTFDQEIWITKDERLLKEVQGFEEAYIEKFGSAATLAQAKVVAGEWSDAFITHLRAVNDRVRALHGFPLGTTTTVTEEALAQGKNEKGTSRKFTAASTEVTRISLETIADSEFEIPSGYINEDTKVVINRPGEATPTRVVAAAPMPAPTVVAKADPVVAKVDPPVAKVDPVVARVDPSAATKPSTASASPSKDGAAVGALAASGPGGVTEQPMVLPRVSPVPTPGPAVAANTAPAVAPGPPTNVLVKGSTGRNQPSAAAARNGETAGNVPTGVIPSGYRTQAPPPPVTIEEPEEYLGKKKRRR